MEKQLYSITEAAALCGVTRMTINRWLKAGILHAEKIGRTSVIPITELARCSKKVPDDKKKEIDAAVKRVVEEYRETLDLLAKE